jgi:SAM-dependent methyltransferase
MELKRPLPPGRTYEQVKNHYLVEKAIADRLKKANCEERKQIYATMYDELFARVPDHPRLTIREDKQLTRAGIKSKQVLVRKFLTPSMIFLEIAPGDCIFAEEIAQYCRQVYAIDISDQRSKQDKCPDNFRLIVYDGYDQTDIAEGSIDLAFSDQLIEHIHPEDTKLHFQLVNRLLKKGGKYLFRTPHWLNGPCDVSRYFSDEPEGFHLKEWKYHEIIRLVKETGYSKLRTYWNAKQLIVRMPYLYFAIAEKVLGSFPKKYTKSVARYFVPSICCAAIK